MLPIRRMPPPGPGPSPAPPGTAAAAGPRDRFSKEDLPYFALFLLLLLFAFREFAFTDRVFFERDTTLVEVPARKLTVDLLRQGPFALWTDAHGNGQPFLANPKNAVLYPTTWLYLVLPLFTAFKLHYLVHVLLGWLGLYALCGSYGLSRRASFLGASLFAFSGMYLASFEFYNHIAALAWMPWVLWLLSRAGRPGRARWALLTLAWALMILAGAPEFVLLTVCLAAGQGLFTAGHWRAKIARTALPLLLAGLITAVQLLPSLELLGRADRSAHAAQWSFELVQLLDLPFPRFFGQGRDPGPGGFWAGHLFDQQAPLYYSLYIGAGALCLALFGLGRGWDRRRKLLLLMAFLFFLLACGRFSPFFFLYHSVPLLGSIRFPVKFFMGSVFCLSILAALGLDEMARARAGGRRAGLAAAGAAGALLSFVLLVRRLPLGPLDRIFLIDNEASLRGLGASLAHGLLVLALFVLAGHLARRAGAGAKAVVWAAIAWAVLDPMVYNRPVNPTVPASFFETARLPAPLKAPLVLCRDETEIPMANDAAVDGLRLHRYYRDSLYPFTAMGDGVRYVLNWDFYGAYSRRDIAVLDAVRKLPPAGLRKVLAYLGCTARIGREPLFARPDALHLAIEGRAVWMERIEAGEAAPFVVFSAVRAVAVEAKLRLFASDVFDPYGTAILEADIGLPARGERPVPDPAVRTLAHSPGREEYAASLPVKGVLVLPGNAAPGWRARIDGRPAEVLEVNLFSKGVLVPAGDHRVDLRYRPGSFLWGAAVSLTALILALAAAAAGAFRSGRKARRA